MWKTINNFSNYVVTSDGRIFSLYKNFSKQLRPRAHTGGYLTIVLINKRAKYYKYIHRLVAEHFLDTWCYNLEVNHKDFNRTNNHYTNLEMVARKDNLLWTKQHNRQAQGENHGRAKLTINEVYAILKLYHTNGMELKDIAKVSSVSKATLCRLVNGKIWKQCNAMFLGNPNNIKDLVGKEEK